MVFSSKTRKTFTTLVERQNSQVFFGRFCYKFKGDNFVVNFSHRFGFRTDEPSGESARKLRVYGYMLHLV